MPNESRLPQNFMDSLRQYKKENCEKWGEKYRRSTERLLSSFLFFVSAKSSYKVENLLLTVISYYYSLYHLSKALLLLLPKYDLDDVRGFNHKKTLSVIKTDFIQRKILSEDFGEMLNLLKKTRELANYSMSRSYDLYEILKDIESEMIS